MLRSTFNSWREYLTPASHAANFKETGEISPQEFVEAGDYLVHKFPTWQWSPAAPGKQRDFLPKEKQFLVTRRVPSYVRATEYLGGSGAGDGGAGGDLVEDEDGWFATETPVHAHRAGGSHSVEDLDEIEDLEDEGAEESDEDNDYNDNSNKRSYDLFIHYSTVYRVPRMYLLGYDSNGNPLTPDAMFEDISSDYKDKTATIEKAPFLNDTTTVSIHPCKHANVMRALMSRAVSAAREKRSLDKLGKLSLSDKSEDDDEDPQDQDLVRADQYLVIFLKFITSVTPGIEHDYTMDAF